MACDELEQILTEALKRLDEQGNHRTLPRPEETTAGTCWAKADHISGERRRAVA
jgi:hypothetical protein